MKGEFLYLDLGTSASWASLEADSKFAGPPSYQFPVLYPGFGMDSEKGMFGKKKNDPAIFSLHSFTALY